MKRLQLLLGSSIGKKFIAAVTGLMLFGFLLGHAAGHLKIFTGVDSSGIPHIDHYGQFLKDFGAPALPPMLALWGARMGLLTAFVVHVVVVIQLSLRNKSSRPEGYVVKKRSAATPAALYMMITGTMILVFVVFHILHFTTGSLQFLGTHVHGEVYDNMSRAFTNPIIAIGYVIVMLMIGVHLYHGVWSLFQTMGLDNPDRNAFLRAFAIAAAILIALTFALIPLSFLIGGMEQIYEYDHKLLSNH